MSFPTHLHTPHPAVARSYSRIPPGADVEYTVELVSLPGKEDDILNLSDEPLSGPAFDSA